MQMLIEEVEKRSRVRGEHVNDWPNKGGGRSGWTGGGSAFVGGRSWHHPARKLGQGGREGFQHRQRGRQGCAGRLGGGQPCTRRAFRRRADCSASCGWIAIASRCRRTFTLPRAPCMPMRGHQLGYRPKTNSYDGWTVALWEQYIRDLAVFGCNAIELIPPRSDDAADSPHFPLPPLRMMAEHVAPGR